MGSTGFRSYCLSLHGDLGRESNRICVPCKPNIWKHYVDDTFTILDRDRIDSFLQHLNSQQPTIHFTMETKKDSKIAFLNTSLSREPDGHLTTSVYRKPTHTDPYLAYDSHHPQSVKRGIVKCLYDRMKRLVTKPSLRRRSIFHLYWSLMDILSSLCKRSPRQEQPPGKSPWQSSNPLPFYPTYREYRSLFTAS